MFKDGNSELCIFVSRTSIAEMQISPVKSASRQQAAQKDMLDLVRPDSRWDRMG